MNEEIGRIAGDLFAKKKIDVFLGYCHDEHVGARPIYISSGDTDLKKKIEQLMFDEHCVMSLPGFLGRLRGERVGIVAKGCDIKCIIGLLQEHQVSRENLVIVAVECDHVKWKGEEMDKCKYCDVHKPDFYDHIMKGARVRDNVTADKKKKIFSVLEKYEKMTSAEKLAFWKKQAKKCIRCYACRQACPLCFCQECAAQQNVPKYIPDVANENANYMWLMNRAYDLAGRCTGCMECDRACPVGIPWYLLNRKMAKTIAVNFGFVSGKKENIGKKTPLSDWSEDDPDKWVR